MTEPSPVESSGAHSGWWSRTSGLKKVMIAGAGAIALAAINYAVPKALDSFRDDYDISVERDLDKIQIKQEVIGGSYIVSRPIQDVPAPPNNADSCEGRYQWARAMGGVLADSGYVRVTLKALRESGVEVKGVEVVDIVRRAPMTGTHLACPGRGGTPDIRTVNIALDEKPPAIEVTNADGTTITPVFTVPQNDVEVFDIAAATVTCDCDWRVKLTLRVGGHDESYIVSDVDGRPFRTSASVNARSYRWRDGSWVDEDAAQPPPTTGGPKKPADVAACRLVTLKEIDAKLGGRFEYGALLDMDTQGVEVAVHESTCTMFRAGRGASTPPRSGPVDAVNVVETTATTADDARRELAARLARYANGHEVQRLTVGDEAFYVDGTFIARKGATFVMVSVSVQDSRQAVVARELGTVAAQRSFG